MARTKTRPVGRTPIKRQACEAWLAKQLAGHPVPAQNILDLGTKHGWGWATVRRAKVNVGAQSFKKGHEWWWFDPITYTPAGAPAIPPAKISPPNILISVSETAEAVEQHKSPQVAPNLSAQQQEFASATRPTYEINNPERTIERVRNQIAPSVPPQLRENFASPNSATSAFHHPSKPAGNVPRVSAPSAPPQPRQQEIPKRLEPPKPLEPAKPRRLHIWDSELAETRDAVISAAGFADLYTMRADIHFRQEQLRAKGLLKESLALNDLLSRINEAVEKKKRSENLE